jgi:AraC-like DNA-binding protein
LSRSLDDDNKQPGEFGMFLGSGSVSSSLIGLLTRYCTQHGLTQLSLSQSTDAQSRLSVQQLQHLLQQIQQQQPDVAALGLAIGCQAQIEDAGVLGYLSLSCHTLWDMLLRFMRYHRLVYDANEVDIDFPDQQLSIAWGTEKFSPSTLQDDLLLSTLLTVIRRILDQPALTPISVNLLHPAHTPTAPYEAFYGCPVQMGSKQTRLLLPLHILDLPFQHADPAQAERLEQQAEALLHALPALNRFDSDLREALIHCMHNGEPNLEQVAQTMHLSVRSLQRRLAEQDANFQQVLAKTRQHLACQYLQDRNLSFADIGFLLGYSDSSTFQRAFKQWTGLSPTNFRLG